MYAPLGSVLWQGKAQFGNHVRLGPRVSQRPSEIHGPNAVSLGCSEFAPLRLRNRVISVLCHTRPQLMSEVRADLKSLSPIWRSPGADAWSWKRSRAFLTSTRPVTLHLHLTYSQLCPRAFPGCPSVVDCPHCFCVTGVRVRKNLFILIHLKNGWHFAVPLPFWLDYMAIPACKVPSMLSVCNCSCHAAFTADQIKVKAKGMGDCMVS